MANDQLAKVGRFSFLDGDARSGQHRIGVPSLHSIMLKARVMASESHGVWDYTIYNWSRFNVSTFLLGDSDTPVGLIAKVSKVPKGWEIYQDDYQIGFIAATPGSEVKPGQSLGGFQLVAPTARYWTNVKYVLTGLWTDETGTDQPGEAFWDFTIGPGLKATNTGGPPSRPPVSIK